MSFAFTPSLGSRALASGVPGSSLAPFPPTWKRKSLEIVRFLFWNLDLQIPITSISFEKTLSHPSNWHNSFFLREMPEKSNTAAWP